MSTSIVLTILAGFFGLLFLEGLYYRIKIQIQARYLFRKIRKHVESIEGTDVQKQELLDMIKQHVLEQDGVKL